MIYEVILSILGDSNVQNGKHMFNKNFIQPNLEGNFICRFAQVQRRHHKQLGV
jgi:hypothetical protein